MTNLKQIVLLAIAVLMSYAIQAQFTRLTNLSPDNSDTASIGEDFLLLNGELYFSAITSTYGRELWKTSAINGGESLVKDITPGSSGTTITLAQINDKLVFGAADSIWASEGTTDGTSVIHNINIERKFTEYDGNLYFQGDKYHIMKTDGTIAGTDTVYQMQAGIFQRFSFYNAVGNLFFPGTDTINFVEPWVSDGTTEGTHILKNFTTNVSGIFNSLFYPLIGTDYDLFFSIRLVNEDREIKERTYRTFGTDEGTVKLFDFLVEANRSAILQDDAIFLANQKIYRSNGSPEGSRAIVDLPHPIGSFPVTALKDQVFFSLNSPETGEELWVSDGTVGGTKMVINLYDSASSNPNYPVVADDLLFYVAGNDSTGQHIWYTDGSESHTIQYSSQFSSIRDMKLIEDNLYFIAADDTGEELWKGQIDDLDLTRPVININTGLLMDYADSSPINLTITTTEAVSGLELSDFNITNGTGENFEGNGSTIFGLDIVPLKDSIVFIELPANIATDMAGNGSVRKTVSFRYDVKNPEVIMEVQGGDSTNATSVVVDFGFDEVVTGFDSLDIQLENAEMESFSENNEGYSMTLNTSLQEGEIIITIPQDSIVDKVGKTMTQDFIHTVSVDRVRPTVVATVDSVVNSQFFEVLIQFSEPIKGIGPDAIYGPTKSYFDTLDNNSYKIGFNMSYQAFYEIGATGFIVRRNYIYDNFGNRMGTDYSREVYVDREIPTITLSSDQYGTDQSTEVEISFSEFPVGFELEDLEVVNGTISDFSGADTLYTLTLTAEQEGDVILSMADSVIQDYAKNYNESVELIYHYDISSPELTAIVDEYSNKQEDSVWMVFNEAIQLIDTSSITTINAELLSFELIDSTSILVQLAPNDEGTVELMFPADAFADLTGNLIENAIEIAYIHDVTSPGLIEKETTVGSNTSPISVTIEFDEPVVNFTPETVVLSNILYEISNFSHIDNLVQFDVAFEDDKTLELSLDTIGVTDRAGNPIPNWSGTIIYDITAPNEFSATFTQSQYAWNAGEKVGFDITQAEIGATFNYSLGTTNPLNIIGEGKVDQNTVIVDNIDVSAEQPGPIYLELTLTDSLGNTSDVFATESLLKLVLGPQPLQGLNLYSENLDLYMTFTDSRYLETEISVSSLDGKEILHVDNNGVAERRIQLPKSGIYIIRLYSEEISEVFKIKL